jgi:UDP-2-acetamido-2-deoxy-ribo-hexuluronate aminotransferase
VELVSLLGLKPVLVDVDPDTYNIDPAGVQKAINARTRAIIPVHLYGQTAAMDEIMQLAQKHNLYVIEDAAQSLGANCDFEGKHPMLGTIGHIGCTSFFPSKNLGCFGDGGACFTNDEVLAEKMLMIVNHGARKKYYNERVGMNSRLDTIHAAVLNEKIKHLDDFIAYRRKVADAYYEQLDGVPFLQLPVIDQRGQHTFNQFTIRVLDGKRDAFKQFLSHHGIPSMIYYPSPLHRQPVFQRFCRSGFSLPVGDMLCQQVLSLPMHTELTKNDQMYITHTIRQFK